MIEIHTEDGMVLINPAFVRTIRLNPDDPKGGSLVELDGGSVLACGERPGTVRHRWHNGGNRHSRTDPEYRHAEQPYHLG